MPEWKTRLQQVRWGNQRIFTGPGLAPENIRQVGHSTLMFCLKTHKHNWPSIVLLVTEQKSVIWMNTAPRGDGGSMSDKKSSWYSPYFGLLVCLHLTGDQLFETEMNYINNHSYSYNFMISDEKYMGKHILLRFVYINFTHTLEKMFKWTRRIWESCLTDKGQRIVTQCMFKI